VIPDDTKTSDQVRELLRKNPQNPQLFNEAAPDDPGQMN
jgi:hypothetical protein